MPPDTSAPAGPGLSWTTCRELERSASDAFYIVDVDRFRDNLRRFLATLRARYRNSHIAYSYKTNYTPRLCEAVEREGGYAEVVSRLEYELARRLAVPPERIILNGPYKPDDDLRRALRDGALVNLDAADELPRLARIAAEMPDRALRVGIRCNVAVAAGEPVSRFGIDVESAEFAAAAVSLRRIPNVTLAGLHCHVATAHKRPESYRRRAERIIELCRGLFAEAPPAIIDLGGGFFGSMTPALREQFTVDIPPFDAYADALAGPLVAAYGDGGSPALIVEPGTALVADAVSLVARVVGRKTVRGRHLAVCTASVYDLKPTLHQKNPEMTVFRSGEHQARGHEAVPTDIVGYTCMEHDCLYRGYHGALATGDYLRFDNAGAYTLVLKPPFIRPSLPIVAIERSAGRVEVVKREATFDDVFGSFALTGGLATSGLTAVPAGSTEGAPV